MGAALGTGDKKSVNVDLNIVPFIDLMSCLTAFLLVTAVWVNIAQINIAPKGKNRDQQIKEEDRPVLSVLVQQDKIWIGATRIQETGFDPIPRTNDPEADWRVFEDKLKGWKTNYFNDRTDIEIAAESNTQHPVQYQDLVSAMDHAIKAGFIDVGLTDPAGLSARPQQ
jgi:biopolymer transport protein ExbD